MMSISRKWQGYWINYTTDHCDHALRKLNYRPAPYFRKTFSCTKKPASAIVYLCGLGWHELYVNGEKIGDRVLAPVVSQFDHHASYIEYDVTKYLKKGKNAVVVLLGNGWYNCATHEVWSFDKASWRDFCKMLCDVVADGKTVLSSDASWKFHDSPVRYNEFREGEIYDAALEIKGVADPGFDDSSWQNAFQCNPPGGLIIREEAVPCRVCKTVAPVSIKKFADGSAVYDFGRNLTGWCRIRVKGEKGAEIELAYSERIHDDGSIDTEDIGKFVKDSFFQTNIYRLRGGKSETWEPRFSYNGFRYVKVTAKGFDLKLEKIEACFVHSDFEKAGHFESSCGMLNTLQKLTCRSYLCNFTGIPTDCPHREKNGWTGDAQIACETGLWNYEAKDSYAHFTRILGDCQRPSGQLPGIAPSGGWGYNWGNGPGWDSALFEIPYRVYEFTGDDSMIREHYDQMKLYVFYCQGMAENNLVRFGLGDWFPPPGLKTAPVELTSTGFYYQVVLMLAAFAEHLGKKEDAAAMRKLASAIRKSFNQKYYRGNGIYGNGEWTSLGSALYFGLVDESEKEKTVSALASLVRKGKCTAQFGIFGAKFIPRVLAENGFADLAYEIVTQDKFPGWGYWVKSGATTLRECWDSVASQNHIMYGDISAWMYRYPAGIAPLEPGFRRFALKPCVIQKLDFVKASHKTPFGMIESAWKRVGKKIVFEFTVPKETVAEVTLPGAKKIVELKAGKYTLCSLKR